MKGLKEAYDDLAVTQPDIAPLETIVEKISFYLRGANIRVINYQTSNEIVLESVYNIFVGGNKLGRGVTIKKLLVSYYGRNPKTPNADTVLQHARMYGYRHKDIGVTRLFLPEKLAEHFRYIHQMETALREIVQLHPDGKFEGIFITRPLQATRRNVLQPESIGLYAAGKNYNPVLPLSGPEAAPVTARLDSMTERYSDEAEYEEINVLTVISLIQATEVDPEEGGTLWDKKTLQAALEKLAILHGGNKAYIRVRRGRRLVAKRRETAGIHDSGELDEIPEDAPLLLMYRMERPDGQAVWWPQLRFPKGGYVIAFSFAEKVEEEDSDIQ
jgi:hypothetical protein